MSGLVVNLSPGADRDAVKRALAERGLWVTALGGGAQLLVAAHSSEVAPGELERVAGVASIAAPPSEHPIVDTLPPRVVVRGVPFGAGAKPVILAGPCSVESAEHARAAAAVLAPLGVAFLRGGAYKPRTSPYAFQGHGAAALRWLRDAADAEGMGVVTEAMSPEEVPAVAEIADLLQIGSRNMHNAPLLRAAGRAGRAILLKRGLAATVEEWLSAGEYCLLHGAPTVLFCERGLRGFDPSTRNLLDLGAVALLAHVRRLPVIVDPSHAAGRRDLVPALSRAALAAGAAGLMLEVHDDPGRALSDGPQALSTRALKEVIDS